MTTKVLTIMAIVGVILFVSYFYFRSEPAADMSVASDAFRESKDDVTAANIPAAPAKPAEPTIEMMTLTGNYVCLPTLSGAATPDCAFGIKTDDGEYYAVNFGASAGSMADFMAGESISANGTFIPSEELNPNHWTKFNSKGLFTVLEKL